MKKALSVFALAFCVALAQAHAQWAVGLAAKAVPVVDTGAGSSPLFGICESLKMTDTQPLYLELSILLSRPSEEGGLANTFGISADYLFLRRGIGNTPFKWYLGAGMCGYAYAQEQSHGFLLCGRAVAGLSFFAEPCAEFFAQVAAEPGALFYAQKARFVMPLPCSAGLRWWL